MCKYKLENASISTSKKPIGVDINAVSSRYSMCEKQVIVSNIMQRRFKIIDHVELLIGKHYIAPDGPHFSPMNIANRAPFY